MVSSECEIHANQQLVIAVELARSLLWTAYPSTPRLQAMSLENVEKLIKEHKVEFVDLRFVDMRGIEQHLTFPAR